MVEARAICITHVHNRQVCLFIFVYRVFLKYVKLNLGIFADSLPSLSFVPYLLWYPGVQELGYLISELYVKSWLWFSKCVPFDTWFWFNHISIMLYNSSCLSQCFDSSNANTIRDITNDIKHRMWIYCKLILIRVVCLWISWNEIIYIYRLVGLTFAGWHAHKICWLQWACLLHNRPRCLWVEILGVWDAPLLC